MNAFADTKNLTDLDNRIDLLAKQFGYKLRGLLSYGQEAVEVARGGGDRRLIALLGDAEERRYELAME